MPSELRDFACDVVLVEMLRHVEIQRIPGLQKLTAFILATGLQTLVYYFISQCQLIQTKTSRS